VLLARSVAAIMSVKSDSRDGVTTSTLAVGGATRHQQASKKRNSGVSGDKRLCKSTHQNAQTSKSSAKICMSGVGRHHGGASAAKNNGRGGGHGVGTAASALAWRIGKAGRNGAPLDKKSREMKVDETATSGWLCQPERPISASGVAWHGVISKVANMAAWISRGAVATSANGIRAWYKGGLRHQWRKTAAHHP